MLPVEFVPGAPGELPEQGALRAAVSFAEGMDGVDLAEIVSQPIVAGVGRPP
jgi:hypothetical protein